MVYENINQELEAFHHPTKNSFSSFLDQRFLMLAAKALWAVCLSLTRSGRKHTLPLQNHIPTDRTYPQGLDCRHAYGRDEIPSDLHRQDNRRNIGRPFLLLHISIHSILQIQNRMHSIQIQERPEPQNTIIRPT